MTEARATAYGVTAKGRTRIQFDFMLDGARYRPTPARTPTEANLKRAPSAARGHQGHATSVTGAPLSMCLPGDLQFREFAGYVGRALDHRGFEKAASPADAEVAIFPANAIGDPQAHRYTYTMPTWGQTGISRSSTQGTLSTFGNTGTYSATTTYTPTYGVNGYTTHHGSYTNSTRFVMRHAYDMRWRSSRAI